MNFFPKQTTCKFCVLFYISVLREKKTSLKTRTKLNRAIVMTFLGVRNLKMCRCRRRLFERKIFSRGFKRKYFL